MYKKIKKGWSKHFDFMLADLCCLCIAYIASCYIRYGTMGTSGMSVYDHFIFMIVAIHILLVFFSEPYHGVLRRGKIQEIKSVIGYNTMFVATISIYTFLAKQSDDLSRGLIILFWVLSMVLTYAVRLVLKRWILKRSNNPKYSSCMLLVTEWKNAEKMIEKLKENEYANIIIRGIVITDVDLKGQSIKGIPVVANKDTLLEYARTQVLDRVLVNVHDEWSTELINQLVTMGVTVHINVEGLSPNYPNCSVEKVNGFNVITTCINVATDRQLFLKRALDIVGSMVGLIICGVAFIFVAPIIYIQSPGPIFFSQTRVGKNGRKFKIYKFRTMYLDAEERKVELMEQNEMNGLMFKIKEDPRIFPAGRVLRAASIDELPQFWNVFKGDMSLVGTRPPTVDEYEKYDLKDKSRLAAQTGMTGMWQVSGRSDIDDFEEVVHLDNEYIKNWTLGMDIKILFKTILVVLGRDGSR